MHYLSIQVDIGIDYMVVGIENRVSIPMGNEKQSGLLGENRAEYSMETEWSTPWK